MGDPHWSRSMATAPNPTRPPSNGTRNLFLPPYTYQHRFLHTKYTSIPDRVSWGFTQMPRVFTSFTSTSFLLQGKSTTFSMHISPTVSSTSSSKKAEAKQSLVELTTRRHSTFSPATTTPATALSPARNPFSWWWCGWCGLALVCHTASSACWLFTTQCAT